MKKTLKNKLKAIGLSLMLGMTAVFMSFSPSATVPVVATNGDSEAVPYVYGVNDGNASLNLGLVTGFGLVDYVEYPIALERGVTTEIRPQDFMTAWVFPSTTLSSVDYTGTVDGKGAYSFFSASPAPKAAELRNPDIILPPQKWAANFTSIKDGGKPFNDYQGTYSKRDLYVGDAVAECIKTQLINQNETIFTITVSPNAPGWDGTLYLWVHCYYAIYADIANPNAYSNGSNKEQKQFYIRIPLVLPQGAGEVDFGDRVPFIRGVNDDRSDYNLGFATALNGASYTNPVKLRRDGVNEIKFTDFIALPLEIACSVRLAAFDWVGAENKEGASSFFSSVPDPRAGDLRNPDIILPRIRWQDNFKSIRGNMDNADAVMSENGLSGDVFGGDEIVSYAGTFHEKDKPLLYIKIADNAPGWDGVLYLWIYMYRAGSVNFQAKTYSNRNSTNATNDIGFYIRIPLVLSDDDGGGGGLGGIVGDVTGLIDDEMKSVLRIGAFVVGGVFIYMIYDKLRPKKNNTKKNNTKKRSYKK